MMGLIGGLAISAGLVEEETILDDENDIGSVSVLEALSSVVPLVPQTTTPGNEQVCHSRKCYENGEIYEGPFWGGMRHGEGAVSSREEGTKFCGTYKYDEPFHGTLITPAYTYNGHLRGNKFHGVGTLAYSNGTIYYGDFKYGLYHGVGKEISSTTKTIPTVGREREDNALTITLEYTGNFQFGRRHGIGTLINSTEQKCIYSGEWKNGLTVDKFPVSDELYDDFHVREEINSGNVLLKVEQEVKENDNDEVEGEVYQLHLASTKQIDASLNGDAHDKTEEKNDEKDQQPELNTNHVNSAEVHTSDVSAHDQPEDKKEEIDQRPDANNTPPQDLDKDSSGDAPGRDQGEEKKEEIDEQYKVYQTHVDSDEEKDYYVTGQADKKAKKGDDISDDLKDNSKNIDESEDN